MADEESDSPPEERRGPPCDQQQESPHEQQDANEHLEDGQKVKKRRLHGACDTCRKRKSDSAIRPENMCSNCEASNVHCTHDIPRQPKKKETQQAYIQSLEERLTKMEHIFRELHPDKDVETLLDLSLTDISKSLSSVLDPVEERDLSRVLPELKYPAPHLPCTILPDGSNSESVAQGNDLEEEEDLSHIGLTEHMEKMFVADKRFFGLASTYMFAHYTLHAKMEASGISSTYPPYSGMLRRPLYWEIRPWELSFARSQESFLVYPEPDLLDALVTLYFDKSNIIIPVLHRPTFLRSLKSGLHRRDSDFGMTVLLVCAIASRYTSDSRVLLDDDISGLSFGWKYFAQFPSFRNRLFERSTLHDLQCYVLAAIYLLGTSTTHVAWPLIGLGIRFAQEKGFHRRNGKRKQTAEDELAKRVFWSLIFLDRWVSAFHGRPCAMQDEEFDLDYPVECDDEYWETSDPGKAFQQPPGNPCKISSFVWMIKLSEIIGFALRTLYATKKSKAIIGFIGNEWESQVVAELDSSMNKWKDSLPHFLRWNPENPDSSYLCQSITLYTLFYHLQIQIHRPFLMKRSALSLTSVAMCTNAARSTAHIVEVAMSRGATLFYSSYVAAFCAALVLLLVHSANQQGDSTFDSKTTMELVRKIFLTLKEGERRWHFNGRFVDLMQTLGCMQDQRSNPQLKRRRDLDIIDPYTSQSQQNRFTHWEPASFVQKEGTLESPTVMQASCVSANSWDVNTLPMSGIQCSHVQQPPIAIQQTPNHPITQTTDPPNMVGTNFHFPLSSQGTHIPYSFHPHLQMHNSIDTEDPTNTMDPNLSDDLFAMWSNLPVSFNSCDWNAFLSDTPQHQHAHSKS